MQSRTKFFRPWRVVAEEVCREKDPMKTVELVHELIESLDEQELGTQAEPEMQSEDPKLGWGPGNKRSAA